MNENFEKVFNSNAMVVNVHVGVKNSYLKEHNLCRLHSSYVFDIENVVKDTTQQMFGAVTKHLIPDWTPLKETQTSWDFHHYSFLFFYKNHFTFFLYIPVGYTTYNEFYDDLKEFIEKDNYFTFSSIKMHIDKTIKNHTLNIYPCQLTYKGLWLLNRLERNV